MFRSARQSLSQERSSGVAKREKDVAQAAALIIALAEKRPEDLRLAWEEAYERGLQWRRLLLGGMKLLSPEARDLLLRVLERPREIVPGMDLAFPDSRARYDFNRETVRFVGEALWGTLCRVL